MPKTKRVNHFNRNLLIGIVVLMALSLPIALMAVRNPVNYTPRAYVQEGAKAIGNQTNTAPSLEGSLFTPINCNLNKACRYTFEGSDPDLYDTLTLTVDFLPPNLRLTDCQTSQNLIGHKKINCQLSGAATRPGTYKLLTSLEDGTNPAVTKTFTLNVN